MFNSILKMAKEKEETPEQVKAREEKEKIQKENRARFVDAATRRFQKACLIIESMQQFSSPNYAYTKDDVELLRKKLIEQVNSTSDYLLNPKSKNQITLFS